MSGVRARLGAAGRLDGRAAAALALLLALALALRGRTLAIPHFDSDEPCFEGLAGSLLEGGPYSVRGVGFTVLEGDPASPFALLALRREAGTKGGILSFYGAVHQEVDDRDLSARAPLYPLVLAASVGILGDGHVRVVAFNRAGFRGSRRSAYAAGPGLLPRSWIRAQLPVVLPSLGASLLLVALGFVAAYRSLGLGPATAAGLALATAPLEVWAAHRVTADTLSGLLSGAAVVAIASVHARAEPSLRRGALAGVLAGLASLAKGSGAIALLVAATVEVTSLAIDARDPGEGRLRRATARLATVAVPCVLVAGLWPVYQLAHASGALGALGGGGVGLSAADAAQAYPRFIHSRPFWVVPASTCVLSPLLGVGAIALAATAVATLAGRGARDSARRPLVHAVAAAGFAAATMLWPSKENRYLLPAYVSLAVGAGLAVAAIDRRLQDWPSRRAGRVLLWIGVAGCAGLSAAVAAELGASGAYELTPLGPAWGGD